MSGGFSTRAGLRWAQRKPARDFSPAQFSDDADLEEVYNTERHILCVACTRARDYLQVTSVYPSSRMTFGHELGCFISELWGRLIACSGLPDRQYRQ